VEAHEPQRETERQAEITDLLAKLACLLSAPPPCSHPAPEPDRALRLEEAAPLFAMSKDFLYRRWQKLGGYKDVDHHIKFRMSDIQRHLQRKAKEGRPCG
jgi:hypothetical protein